MESRWLELHSIIHKLGSAGGKNGSSTWVVSGIFIYLSKDNLKRYFLNVLDSMSTNISLNSSMVNSFNLYRKWWCHKPISDSDKWNKGYFESELKHFTSAIVVQKKIAGVDMQTWYFFSLFFHLLFAVNCKQDIYFHVYFIN